jgi:NAD(P)H-hydrate epimerase
MPGAAILVTRAAQKAGAGLVRLWCRDDGLVAIVAHASPETVFSGADPTAFDDAEQHAVAIGPGFGTDQLARDCIVRAARSHRYALLLDADALTLLAREPGLVAGRRAVLVMTPHPGEAARLLGRAIPADAGGRADAAREIAARFGAIVCLKGRRSVVTDGERTYVNDTGNAGMATAGAGDVLTGMAAAYLAQTASLASTHGAEWTPFDAAACAVRVHGIAGDLAAAKLGQRAVVASDLIEYLPEAQQRTDAV